MDGVHPLDPAFGHAIRYGITTAHIMPGRSNVIGGTTSVIKTSGTLPRRSKIELKNKSWSTYQALSENGIEVSITTDHPYTPIQYLNVCAAIAVREGMDEQKALEGITLTAARNLGISDKVGSLETGKDADIVLWNHHPFHFLAKPEMTMIDGQIVYTKA